MNVPFYKIIILETRNKLKRLNSVGPVLISGEIADAIVGAIRQLNRDVIVDDQGAYMRVSVPHKCFITRKTIENRLNRVFVLPGDLEKVLLSSRGKLTITMQEIVWEV